MLESNMRCFEQKYEKDNKIIKIGRKNYEKVYINIIPAYDGRKLAGQRVNHPSKGLYIQRSI